LLVIADNADSSDCYAWWSNPQYWRLTFIADTKNKKRWTLKGTFLCL